MSNFLEKNIKALAKVDPVTAARVHEISGNVKFEVFVDSDPANINIIEMETKEPIFAGKPTDECLKIVTDMAPKSNYPYHYFFGMGNGIVYKMLLSNDRIKRIVVFEPEPELIYIAFNFIDFSEDILNKRFVVMCTKDVSFVRVSSLIRYKDAKIYSRLYDLDILTPYYGKYREDIVLLSKMFVRAIEDAVISVGNDSKDALMGIEHHVRNIPRMLKTPTLHELIKKSRNTDVAIIVSTGPSLDKQLPILREIQDFVTIFSVDASFPILCANGIKPDVVLTMERIELTSEFYKQTPKECFEGVVFELTSIVHEELVNSIKGGTIQMSMRPFGYTNYFKFDQWGYIGIGMSAANMAYELVAYSQFPNIVFIGQDLAFTDDGKTHTKGHIIDESKVEAQFQNTDIFVEKYGGGGEVKSTAVWKMFLNFFERDIAETPQSVNVINATEGGARIVGTKEMPFLEVANTLPDRTKPKAKIVLDPVDEALADDNIEKAKTIIRGILDYSAETKAKIEALFLDVVATTEKLEELNREERLEEIDFDNILNLIDRIDDIKDMFLHEKFTKLFVDAVQSYVINQELEIAKIQVKFTGEDEWHKKAKLIDWIYAHKQWLFWLAGGINGVIEVVKRGAKDWAEIDEYLLEEEAKNG